MKIFIHRITTATINDTTSNIDNNKFSEANKKTI